MLSRDHTIYVDLDRWEHYNRDGSIESWFVAHSFVTDGVTTIRYAEDRQLDHLEVLRLYPHGLATIPIDVRFFYGATEVDRESPLTAGELFRDDMAWSIITRYRVPELIDSRSTSSET